MKTITFSALPTIIQSKYIASMVMLVKVHEDRQGVEVYTIQLRNRTDKWRYVAGNWERK